MKELNENSLQKAIQQLPRHKAGNFVWEEVRWQLDKPLSAELPLHIAPVGSWQSIRAASVASGKTNVIRISAIASLILLCCSIVLYPVLFDVTDQYTEPEMSVSRNTTPSKISGIATSRENQSGITAPAGQKTVRQRYYQAPPAEKPESENTATMVSIIIPNENQGMMVHPVSPKDGQSIPTFLPDLQKTIRWRNDPRYAECATFREVNTAVFMVADYEPELFGDKVFNVPVHNFSVSSGYRHNRLGITLGAGFTRITGTSELSYAYRTNELVYSYDYVDSVYVDPVTHETYYFTVKVDVYDSIDHTTTEQVTDRYSYLQIPLSISYELAGFNKLSLNLQLTGTYHLLQDDYRNYDPFHEASSRLVSTTMEEKKIDSDYWSAGAGLMVAYQAGNRLGVSLTPRIKYNSLPVKGSTDKGFISYGINFGIFYKITGDP
ncbi:MAG: hypothetical protein IPH20_01075 [Bacteroidales bacterium]|nr:hypothetical protein [Bacteroidales bacterium]